MTLSIFDFFPKTRVLSILDNFINYELKFISSVDSEQIKKFDQEAYGKFNSQISSYEYDWSLEIEELNYSISQSKYIKIESEDLEDYKEININLIIFKKGKKNIIFNEDKFTENISNLGLEDLLKIFSSKYNNGLILLNDKSSYKSSSHYIGYNSDLKEQQESDLKISSQCNFNNLSDFKFSPNHFNINSFIKEDPLLHLINKIYQVFILVFIFDRSEITKNEIKLKINGFKTIDYILDFEKLETTSLNVYEKIFNWIYSENNKIEDKIGIARNILSIYLKEVNVNIDENTFNSILSANNTYIKGNISKYIDTRNKIHEQVEQVSTKVNSSLETFYNNFQKSIFVFISFYLTIFVLKVYTKENPTSVINK